MKQLILAGVFCLLAAGATLAQRTDFNNTVISNDFFTIKELAGKPGKVEGTTYLSDSWRPGSVYLKSGHILKGFKLNYDLEYDMIEIDTKDGIKVLPGNKAAKFTLWNGFNTDSLLYVNCDAYTYKNIRHLGFYEVVQTGPKLQLLVRTDIQVQKANYNAITDTGSKNVRILKKEKVYAAAGKTVMEVKNNDDFEIFGPQQEAIEHYAKTNKLKLKRKADAQKLIAYYNSI